MKNVVLDEAQLNSQIREVLKIQSMGTAEEIAFTIAEMQGISTEEGNAEMILAVREQVERMVEAHTLEVVRSRHSSKRYRIVDNQAEPG